MTSVLKLQLCSKLQLGYTKWRLTGKFLAESMKTVSSAVLMSVTLSIWVSSRANFKSLLSLLSCIHVNLKWTMPVLACSSVSQVSTSPFLTTVEISTVALREFKKSVRMWTFEKGFMASKHCFTFKISKESFHKNSLKLNFNWKLVTISKDA